MKARHLAEPLLWLAVAVGVLWMLVLIDLWGADLDNPDGPIAARLPLVAATLGPGLCLSAGTALALLRRTGHARWVALVVGGLLVAAGFGFRRIPEIDRGEIAGGYFWVPVVAGVVLGLTVLAAPWPKPDGAPPDPAATSPIALVFLAGLGSAGLILLELSRWGWVGVWEEDQPAWDYGLPVVLAGVGAIPAAIYSYRGRWPALGITMLLTGTAFMIAALGAVIAT